MGFLGAHKNTGKWGAALVASAVLCLSSPAAAQKQPLPDVTSGAAMDDLRFPKESWDHAVLVQLEKGPRYLERDEVFVLPAPAANSSDETKSEIEAMRALMLRRDDATLALIRRENAEDAFTAVVEGAGMIPIDAKAEAMRAVLKEAVNEVGFFVLREKERFGRARPIQLAPYLKPVIETPGHASYPSGHAAQAYAAAEILALVDPPQNERYYAVAQDVAKRREIAGVHFASDTQAGIDLARQVVEKLLQNAEFLDKLQAAEKTFTPIHRQ